MTLIYSGDEEYGDDVTSPAPDEEDEVGRWWYGDPEHQADEARRRHYERKYGEEP